MTTRVLAFTLFSFFQVLSFNSRSQLYTTSTNMTDLVELLAGWGIVTYGETSLGAVGYFTSNNTILEADFGIENGAILTTGSIDTASHQGPEGPNDFGSAGTDNGSPGSSWISNLVNNGLESYNVAYLSFNVVAISNEFKLTYLFGSEEYTYFVGSVFADAMGIFISGPGIIGDQNIALAPDGQNVTVSTIHPDVTNSYGTFPAQNANYYVHNGDGSEAPYNASDYYIQYNGYTTPLEAVASVIPGEHYQITIMVADVADAIYDSGVFIPSRTLVANSDEEVISKVNIFPNPTTDMINVQMSDGQSYEYSIISEDGRTIENGEIKEKINVEDLDKGKYFLVIHTDEPIVKTFQKQ